MLLWVACAPVGAFVFFLIRQKSVCNYGIFEALYANIIGSQVSFFSWQLYVYIKETFVCTDKETNENSEKSEDTVTSDTKTCGVGPANYVSVCFHDASWCCIRLILLLWLSLSLSLCVCYLSLSLSLSHSLSLSLCSVSPLGFLFVFLDLLELLWWFCFVFSLDFSFVFLVLHVHILSVW